MQAMTRIARRFLTSDCDIVVEPYGSGNINDTFLVTWPTGKFVLQRINQNVFPEPELIMRNLRTFTDHVKVRLQDAATPAHPWLTPDIVPTRAGADYVLDDVGDFWRALTFIAGAQTYPFIHDRAHAREVGYALGHFQRLICDLPPAKLYDTLKGFHVLPHYLRHYDEVLRAPVVPLTSPDVRHCLRVIETHRAWGAVLEDARARGELKLRAIHGDPKVDNIMIDDVTGQAISLIDLDTVKPGLIHYDIGDCLRSGCNPLGEEPDDPAGVRFELDLCEAILEGYLPEARGFLTEYDLQYLYDAVRLLVFEMGLRFFTDYLEGDVYFKVRDPAHNLLRAVVQFRLLASIEAQEQAIRAILKALR